MWAELTTTNIRVREDMLNEEIKKFVKEELQKVRREISEEIRKLRTFSETYLLMLLDLSMINDTHERFTRVLSAVSADFPQVILEIYVKRAVHRAKASKMEFEDFADCLIKGLGDKVKELSLSDEVTRVYGFKAGERWKKLVETSNNPTISDCKCKTSSK